MKFHLQYSRYLIRHKWFVFCACMRVAPYRLFFRAVIHDWSKFLPSEWFAYVESFYGHFSRKNLKGVVFSDHETREGYIKSLGRGVPFHKVMEKTEKMNHAFNRAWLMHQKRNDHHWQYWCLRMDDGPTIALEMPRIAVLEMYCDWVGAGRAITGKIDVIGWYMKNKNKMTLHEKSRAMVEEIMHADAQRRAFEERHPDLCA